MTAEVNVLPGEFAKMTHIPVSFDGGRDRAGSLTQGQANTRRCVLRDNPVHMALRVCWPLPAGTSVMQVADTVRALLLRHESLRTTYPESPELCQQVAGAGLLEIVQYDSDGGLKPAALALQIGQLMCAARFDLPTEFPIRVAVVSEDAIPTHIVIVLSHMAADAAALGTIAAEWDELISGRPLGLPSSVQPVDLAGTEHAPAGQRRMASSLRYWERLLLRAPQAAFPVSGAGETDWMTQPLRIRSRRAAEALGQIKARTGAGPSTIILAAMCALVAHRVAHRSFTVALPSANRYLPGLTDYVGTISQDALMSVDLDDSTFDEVIRHVRTRSFTAYRYSWFDSDALWEIITQACGSRGTTFIRDCVFNDISALALNRLESRFALSPEGYDAATEAELTWLPPEPMPTRLVLWAIRLDEEVELCLWADRHIFSAAETEGFARAMIRLLLAAAEHDIALAGMPAIAPVTRGAGWYLVDSCWVEIAAVRLLVAGAVGARPFWLSRSRTRSWGTGWCATWQRTTFVSRPEEMPVRPMPVRPMPVRPSGAPDAGAPGAVPGGRITPEWVHARCVAGLSSFRPPPWRRTTTCSVPCPGMVSTPRRGGASRCSSKARDAATAHAPGVRRRMGRAHEAMTPAAPGLAFWSPAFRLYFTARTVSLLGDMMLPVALTVGVIGAGYGASGVGYVLAARVAPVALLVLFGGVFADRFTPRRMMVGADLVRLAAQGATAFAFATGKPALAELIATQAVSGAASAMFQPGIAATVRQIAADVQRANATLRTAEAVVTMLGPVVAGLLVATSGAGAVFGADAATFAVSAACLFGLRLKPDAAAPGGGRIWRDLADGWREFRARTWLWAVITIWALYSLAVFGPVLPLTSIILIPAHGSRVYALMLSAFGVGTVLGGAAGIRLRPRRPVAAGALAMLAFALNPVAVASGACVDLVAAGFLLAGAAMAFWSVMWSTTVQTQIPADMLNRVSSYDIAGSLVVLPLGTALAGPVAAAAGTRPVLFASAVIGTACCLGMLAVPQIRNLRRAPETS